MRRSFLTPLAGTFCLLLAASAVAAQDSPLQAFRGSDALTLLPAEGEARIELPGGRVLRVPLPERADLSSFAALDGGWVAVGSVPDAAGGRKLFLLRGNDKASRPLPEPPGQEGRDRRGAVLLVDHGRLAGLAWLEGDDSRSLAVRSAAWTGQKWGAPERVSFPGPGSQLALAGAVLADGSWLLAWSAFDGEDDEIVWTRRSGDAWQPVERLSPGNHVPDITPAVTATAGGALIAWSRYDGEGYQLRVARFARGGWTGERPAAPSGSLYPGFVGGSRLLYLDASPRAWSVLDLDGEGRAKARASVPSAAPERPAVSFDGATVRMRWPGRKALAVPLERVP